MKGRVIQVSRIDKSLYRPVRKPRALPPKLTRIIKLKNGGNVENDNNVVPFVNPNEKPWYETDEGKKLIAKSDRSELISILGGLTGQSESYFKKMKTKDLIDELQRFADFKMAMKEGGLITNYKKDLRKP